MQSDRDIDDNDDHKLKVEEIHQPQKDENKASKSSKNFSIQKYEPRIGKKGHTIDPNLDLTNDGRE